MEIRLSAHGAYHHQFHLVWIPKYRKRILKGELKACLAGRLGVIHEYHPEVEVEQFSIQVDHVHLVAVIPPKFTVSAIVGKIKANTSREIRQQFPWVKKVYWRNEFWSEGFFSSTVGIDEAVIKRYVEFQEKVDKGQLKLQLDFGLLIAKDVVDHFERRYEALGGKVMFVCMSRRICVDLYNAIAQLRPAWIDPDDAAGSLKVVMTGSAADPIEWQPHIGNKARREALAKRFKNPTDPFKFAIVRDMRLTGFDVPSLHTLYLDKPMRGHRLDAGHRARQSRLQRQARRTGGGLSWPRRRTPQGAGRLYRRRSTADLRPQERKSRLP